MGRVGRPPLPYDVKHVTINMKQEHYVRMRRDGTNMSRVINTFLDDLYGFTICPKCYSDEITVQRCAKCDGRALFCNALGCEYLNKAQMRECVPTSDESYQVRTCTAAEFHG